jgi:hypothetical protein
MACGILLNEMRAYDIMRMKRGGQRAMYRCNEARRVREAGETFLSGIETGLKNLTWRVV